jgi:uncharacterized ferritin-like protein (DUF455 family)
VRPALDATMTAITILSLMVTALAVFVTWRVAKRQRAATMRQAWMKEFREEVAKLLSTQLGFNALGAKYTNYPTTDPDLERIKSDLNDRMSLSYYKIRLLIGENAQEYKPFVAAFYDFMKAPKQDKDIVDAAIKILRDERGRI